MVMLKNKVFSFLKYLMLPLLTAIFPALFLYGNNVAKLLASSLGKALLLYSVIAIIIYSIYNVILKNDNIKAANAAFIFLIFFDVYGIIYSFLIEKDFFSVEHYTLLPLFLLLAIYTSWLVTKVNPVSFWNTAITVIALLVTFNLIKIIPDEVTKQRLASQQETTKSVTPNLNKTTTENYPDIYFLIFDEFAGFDAMRNYWHYQGVDDFITFVKSKGFFVAEQSQSSSTVTLHLMAERLNYKEFPIDDKNVNIYYKDINDSRVVNFLKSLGYTTVVFDETAYWYDTYIPMPSDYTYLWDESNKPRGWQSFFDEFGSLVAGNSMLKAFENLYKPVSGEPTFFEQHRKYVFFTMEKIGQLNEIPSPKFVYVHLMLPHNPFMFDAQGGPVNQESYQDWNYYLAQYKFTITVIEKMIDNILGSANPDNPPVIIIQSDHGARNIVPKGGVPLENYPDDYKKHVLNIMLIPGFNTSKLPQDLKPINTFPIIFNYLFDAGIPLK